MWIFRGPVHDFGPGPAELGPVPRKRVQLLHGGYFRVFTVNNGTGKDLEMKLVQYTLCTVYSILYELLIARGKAFD